MEMSDYWKECIAEAFEDAGVAATDDQIEKIAQCVEGASQTLDMAFGRYCIPNAAGEENKQLRKALTKEREKVLCESCRGTGSIVDLIGACHYSQSTCWRCKGEGRHAP